MLLMGKSTISMAMFNSKLLVYQRLVVQLLTHLVSFAKPQCLVVCYIHQLALGGVHLGTASQRNHLPSGKLTYIAVENGHRNRYL